VNDSRRKRLELLRRLREMNVEQARADHVAAQAELDRCRERADETERRIEALDAWSGERAAQGQVLAPEILRQAQLFRGVEKQALTEQRAAQQKQLDVTEEARGELGARFEELSVVERLAERHAQHTTREEFRRAYVDLDEAGAQRMNLEERE
jgi:flagellar export protein FliJ